MPAPEEALEPMPPLRLLKAPSLGKRMHAFGCCRCPLE
jgi:hypothetical protein